MEIKKDVFVIMPFSSTATCTESQWNEIYENVFKPAIEDCGYTCERALPMTGRLTRSIVDKLRYARIVLADITDKNPNVFYELGVRHSLSKRTIVVAQGNQHTPSDLLGYWYISYGISPGQVVQFKKDVKRLIHEIDSSPDKSDNPVSDYLEEENLVISSYVQKESIKKLGALFTEFTGNTIQLKAMSQGTEAFRYVPYDVSYDCLNLLLQTLYIDIGPDLLKLAYELQYKLRSIERGYRTEEFLQTTIDDLNSLSIEILKIRDKLISGEYSEPTSISTMVWKPVVPDLLHKYSPLLEAMSPLRETISPLNLEHVTSAAIRGLRQSCSSFLFDEHLNDKHVLMYDDAISQSNLNERNILNMKEILGSRTRDKTLGVLMLSCCRSYRAQEEFNVEILDALAKHASDAIQNASDRKDVPGIWQYMSQREKDSGIKRDVLSLTHNVRRSRPRKTPKRNQKNRK